MLKFALLLMIVLTGCANYSWVSVSDNGNYDFFQNGKLVCESTSSCRIGSSWGDKMLLEIRKGDVTYAHLVVFSKEKNVTMWTMIRSALWVRNFLNIGKASLIPKAMSW